MDTDCPDNPSITGTDPQLGTSSVGNQASLRGATGTLRLTIYVAWWCHSNRYTLEAGLRAYYVAKRQNENRISRLISGRTRIRSRV